MSTQKQLFDWLDDLCVRFIINLPQEELEDVARICFQVEEAQWFYEDFVRPIDPSLPSLNLKQFCLKIFQHCPLLSAFSQEQHLAAYEEFLGYKTRVPVRGAIMLNEAMDKVVLVKGWKSGASWSFPRGKINKDEPDLDCAIREVYEETGLDIKAAGLAQDPDAVKAIDVTMRQQHMRLFVFRNVPEDTPFEPKTRKEISKISWYKLSELPTLKKQKHAGIDAHEAHGANKFYMVAPFLGPLRKWIHHQRKIDAQEAEYADDLPSEAPIENQQMRVRHTPVPAEAPSDPTAELKRLLSVQNDSGQLPQVMAPDAQLQDKSQAVSLLAMLRGGSSGQAPQQMPHTPFEQVGGFPQQPQTPHAQHVRESPVARAQAPPQFAQGPSFPSPQQSQAFDHSGLGPVFPERQLNANQSNLLSMLQQPSRGPSDGHMNHPLSLLPELGSGRSDGAFETTTRHMPAAPAASQLPAPRLSNQAMDLLSVFRSGQRGAQQGALPISQTPGSSVRDDPAQLPALLGLAKLASPDAAAAAQDPSAQASSGLPEETRNVSEDARRPSTATSRKTSAMSMITRKLPKAKQAIPSVPAPTIDDNNFPSLGSQRAPSSTTPQPRTPLTEKPVPIQLSSVKILTRPGPADTASSTTARPASRPPSRGKPGPPTPQPVTILQRPSSASQKLAPSPKRSRAEAAAPKSSLPFQPQILKRGEVMSPPLELSADTTRTPPAEKQEAEVKVAAPSPAQRDTLLSLFAQSQGGSRASPTVPLASASPLSPTGFGPPSGLFGATNSNRPVATSGLSSGSLADIRSAQQPPVSRHGSQGSMSFGAVGGHGVIGDRSRAPSAAGLAGALLSRQGSVVRQGSLGGRSATGDAELPKSPSTPVEKKGFLMDYLNGVVQGGR